FLGDQCVADHQLLWPVSLRNNTLVGDNLDRDGRAPNVCGNGAEFWGDLIVEKPRTCTRGGDDVSRLGARCRGGVNVSLTGELWSGKSSHAEGSSSTELYWKATRQGSLDIGVRRVLCNINDLEHWPLKVIALNPGNISTRDGPRHRAVRIWDSDHPVIHTQT